MIFLGHIGSRVGLQIMDALLFRQLGDVDLDGAESAGRGQLPGKATLTSRLTRAAQLNVLRTSDPAVARAFGEGLSSGRRDDNGVAEGAESAVARAATSSGAPLPAALQRQFEGSLGADLSSVRVHTGPTSVDAAHAVGAKAYTVGQDIHFGAGQYAPDDPFGMHLLAHEVAHTVQQSGGAARRQHKLEVSTPHDAAEHEADRAADAMVRGDAFVVGLHTGDWLGRAGEDKTGKGAVTISTKGLKLNEEGSMKLGTLNIGKWLTAEVTGTLIGEEALVWSKRKGEVGVTVAGSYNSTKGEPGVDEGGQFNWTSYQDKARAQMHQALGERWRDGFQVVEQKETIDLPTIKFRPEAVQFGCGVAIAFTFANKTKVTGGMQFVVKGGKDVKPTDQGLQFSGTAEHPIFDGETSLGDDVTIKGKLVAKLELKLKPAYETIARAILEKVAEKAAQKGAQAAQGTAATGAATAAGNGTAAAAPGAAAPSAAAPAASGASSASSVGSGAATTAEGAATTAEGAATTAEGAATTAEGAAGATVAETAIAVGGGLLIVATMGYALAQGAQDLADADRVVTAANQARDSWASGYCAGLGAARTGGDAAAYSAGLAAGRAKLAAVMAQMRTRLGNTPATDEELATALAGQVNQNVGAIFDNARKSMASTIGTQFVQSFWSQHAGSWYGRIGLSQTTRNIAGRLGVAWSPPAADASDAPAPTESQPLANPGDAPGSCDEETATCDE